MTGKFCAGKLHRLSVAVREQLLLKIPRDVAAILRNQQRGGSTGDSSDEDDQETGETNDAPMREADGNSDGEVEVGVAIAPAGSGIVRPAHVGRFGAELHGSSVLFKWNAGDSADDTWQAPGSWPRSWLEGKVWKRAPSKVDVKTCPTANAIVKFAMGAVACELSRETYGVDLKWVLLRKLG